MSWRGLAAAAALTTAAIAATAAQADPCEAPLPKRGEVFAGPVRYVGDGDSLCVDVAGRGLVEVRVADFNAPELAEPAGPAAKAALIRLAIGRRLTCQAGPRSHDRVVALCRFDSGRTLGQALRAAGAVEGGR